MKTVTLIDYIDDRMAFKHPAMLKIMARTAQKKQQAQRVPKFVRSFMIFIETNKFIVLHTKPQYIESTEKQLLDVRIHIDHRPVYAAHRKTIDDQTKDRDRP